MKLSYKARRRLKKFFTIGCALCLVLAVGILIWILWLDRHVVYDRDGAYLDLSRSSKDLEGEYVKATEPPEPVRIYYNEGENVIITTAELVQLTGYYINADMLSKDFDGVLDTLRKLPPGTPVMVDVKDEMGRFFYPSSLGSNLKTIDPIRMKQLIEELCASDLYAIARFPAYREYLFAVDNVNYGLSSTKGAYLYWDPDRCYWLDPTKQGTMNFLMQELTEVKSMGFDEVVLADFRFPDTKEVRFTGDRTQALNDAAKTLNDTFSGDRFALSFEVTDPNFVLPECRTRLYKIGYMAEDAKKIAEESGLDDTAVRLVFTTELLDTRFDPYGVLRPITSAHIEE
jgi:hypothetical protein